MTIETKYDIGDMVSYRPKHPALSSVITSVIHEVLLNGETVEYVMSNGELVEESRILPK